MHRYIDTCFTDKKNINTDLGTSLWWYTLKELRSSISPNIMLGKQKWYALDTIFFSKQACNAILDLLSSS